ncbi:hypothetical protein PPL_03087 [Heterostelium album PN500]|uniref:B box-type domain-containing protein n=1 Tax=Heterostelium pallidum (strain ATCC 26659 / Pp 5 / PN500) TaxID=670386 RepID=D3B3W6_HETP5|nr:hypothetical protein PPL_03087 [Heterostelium album PN500]EFA84014.1 hypothetical protein PPL_03087 [Heterostelium album PN500]|eukprot:XP_020436131.1 hypothetical protein PPL_03087 [Heterostelium album PN500]
MDSNNINSSSSNSDSNVSFYGSGVGSNIVNEKSHCQTHRRDFEYICYQCNRLLCSKCYHNHNKENIDHNKYCQDIDDIKQGLKSTLFEIEQSQPQTDQVYQDNNNNNNNNNTSYNNNNNNGDECCYIKSRLSMLWNTLKAATLQCQTLESNQNEISQHFQQLHEYLVVEEHRLKKPMVNDIDSLKQTLTNNIKELKELVNIIQINNNDSNKNSINSNNSSSSNSNDNDNNNVDGITDEYNITNIMNSITVNSTSLQSFIQSNNNTLFQRITNINDLLVDHYNNNYDSMLLDLIFKYNDRFKFTSMPTNSTTTTTTTSQNQQYDQYKVTINDIDLNNRYNNFLKQTIKVVILPGVSKDSTEATSRPKQPFLLLSHYDDDNGGLALMDFVNKENPEAHVQLKYGFLGTFNSMVTVGEHVYVFGGFAQRKMYCRFSTRTNSIEHTGEMVGVEGGFFISACYDGQDHIYLLGGKLDSISYLDRIDRFNIRTSRFERYHQLGQVGTRTYSFHYKGLIYSVLWNQKNAHISIFNPANKTNDQYQSNHLFSRIRAACSDQNGNLYMIPRDEHRFIRFNVETKQIDNLALSPFKTRHFLSAVYYKSAVDGADAIYFLGGSKYKNHKYSIEDNRWYTFLSNDPLERYDCGSVLFEYQYV